ncbi:MAG: hypothetical protein DCE92_01955 [Alphaproteobacteria bacterium]|nr:MAG: hypothetical protein DCE92_01955 [Alphaproteobacteria bacterium]
MGMHGYGMTLIAKCPPFPLSEQGERILELPAYKAAMPQLGDILYLWFSESADGDGLAGRARVAAVRSGKPLTVAIVVDTATCASPFGKADLAAWRDVESRDPRSRLAAKLYRHSLNKIAVLEPDEAELLEARLTGSPGLTGPEGVEQ